MCSMDTPQPTKNFTPMGRDPHFLSDVYNQCYFNNLLYVCAYFLRIFLKTFDGYFLLKKHNHNN